MSRTYDVAAGSCRLSEPPTFVSCWSLSGLSDLRASSKPNVDQYNLLHCRPLHASDRPYYTMPPKQRAPVPQTVPGTPFSAVKPKSSNDAQDIVQGVWGRYVEKTTQRTKLLDSFMLFLVAVGALQFLYVVIVGNFVSITLNTPGASRTYRCN
jgi:hypothetical protein